jgi:hypothetical protein
VSYLTDRNTMVLARQLLETSGAEGLRLIVLNQVLLSRPEDFTAVAHLTAGKGAAEVLVVLEEHWKAEAQADGGQPRKSSLSNSLRSGSQNYLSRFGERSGPEAAKVAAAIAALNANVGPAWSRIAAGEAALAVLTDKQGLALDNFRAVCVARLLWYYTDRQHGMPPSACEVGVGAGDALQQLAGGRDSAALERLLPDMQQALWEQDRFGVLSILRALGIDYSSAQFVEHLLCEAGKLFGTGRRALHKPRPGYKKLFFEAVLFFRR